VFGSCIWTIEAIIGTGTGSINSSRNITGTGSINSSRNLCCSRVELDREAIIGVLIDA